VLRRLSGRGRVVAVTRGFGFGKWVRFRMSCLILSLGGSGVFLPYFFLYLCPIFSSLHHSSSLEDNIFFTFKSSFFSFTSIVHFFFNVSISYSVMYVRNLHTE
jgi:hypothetical protein